MSTPVSGSLPSVPLSIDPASDALIWWDDATKTWMQAPSGGSGTGTVTSITAGAGLTGGTITTSGTIALASPVAIANGGTGATTAAAALANLGGLPVTGGAISGNLSVSGTTALDGTTATTPATADNSTSVATTAFVKAQGYQTGNQTITLSGDVTGSGATAIAGTVTGLQGHPVSATAPGANQVLEWSGTAWTPTTLSAGGTITGVTAGTGLTGGGTSGNVTVSLSSPVAVANGGTGATTAGGALTALGAAPTASPTFTGTIIAASATFSGTASFTGAITPTGGITGVTNGSNAAAGQVGEVLSATLGTNVGLGTDGGWQSVLTLALTAGDWDVWGTGVITTTIGTTGVASNVGVSLNFSGETLGTINPALNNVTFQSGTTQFAVPTPMRRYSSASSTTVTLACMAIAFGVSKTVTSATIYARRMR